jgi:hypothetical protein
MLWFFQSLLSQQVQKNNSTHFAKPNLEQKHNSFYAKSSKVPKYIIAISKNKDLAKKTPLTSRREDFKSVKKWSKP